MSERSFDVIFAGGGLAAGLCAYRLRQMRPELKLLVLEAGRTLGGNHTWSFHDSDISPKARVWIAPFVAHTWPRQEVRFPKHARMLTSGYNTIFSETLHAVAAAALGDSVALSSKVRLAEPHRVILENGEALSAACVIDARGAGWLDGLALGYQKFVGVEVRFDAPHGQPHPIIMDATVPQHDGYRFVYTLPFAPDRMLIEDTYYSDTPALDVSLLQERCLDYARQRGWRVAETVRTETGVLPIVLGGDLDAVARWKEAGVPALGLRGGFFHHTTSYSLPFAVRCADAIAALCPLTSETLDAAAAAWAARHWENQAFFRLLNRMLFWAAKPEQRYRVLERFYELREPLIERFYSSTLTIADRARILLGWPPVPIASALRVMSETRINPLAPRSAAPAS